MTFDDLEKSLKKYFRAASHHSPRRAYKTNLKALLCEEFEATKNQKSGFFLWQPSWFKSSSLGFTAVAALVLLNIFPAGEGNIIAGHITPQGGLVEILREGETFVLEDPLVLQAGDCVRIGNRSKAEIVIGELISRAKDKTTLCVQEGGHLFLEQGSLYNYGNGDISTERGVLRSQEDAEFLVTVSESGETKAVAQKNKLFVFDTESRKAGLSAGEELSIRTDTQLSIQDLPKDLNLSRTQLEALSLKLVIARTKALTALEAFLEKESDQGLRDLLSAEKTFRSMVQVLDSGRDLQIVKRRHLRLISLSEVYDQLYEKTKNTSLLAETRAVERLLSLLRQNKKQLTFAHPKSGVEAFDRYVLIQKLFQKGLHAEDASQLLQQKYINVFLQKILAVKLKTDQISTLTTEIAKLPNSEEASLFLSSVRTRLPSELAQILSTPF